MSRKSDVFTGMSAILIAMFFFGIDSIFTKQLLLLGWNAIILTMIIRIIKSTFIYVFVKLQRKTLSWKNTKGVRLKLIALGFVGAGGYLLFVWALSYS
ncbi:hypothetical protein, partial [Candidatus Entotheonella palauensis]|uniref:hypothetical protein n=1 Tax=Candidatus Entotheonella palauensis TaxID=93172 RepID=UPI001C4DDE6D